MNQFKRPLQKKNEEKDYERQLLLSQNWKSDNYMERNEEQLEKLTI